MRRRNHRVMAQRALADQLDRLAVGYRARARDLVRDSDLVRDLALIRDRALVRDGALVRDLVRDLDRARDLVHDLVHDLDLDLALDLVRARARDFDRALGRALDFDLALDLARDLARDLADLARDLADLARRVENLASRLRADGQPTPARRDDRVEAHVLACLSRFLPAAERSRFVAEERANLGDDDVCWRERVDRLVDLAIETPRLAWRLRRGGWRERA